MTNTINPSLRHRQRGPMAIGIPNTFYRHRLQLRSSRNRQLRPSQSPPVLRHDTKHPSADGGRLSSRHVRTTPGLLSALRHLAACEAHRSGIARARRGQLCLKIYRQKKKSTEASSVVLAFAIGAGS